MPFVPKARIGAAGTDGKTVRGATVVDSAAIPLRGRPGMSPTAGSAAPALVGSAVTSRAQPRPAGAPLRRVQQIRPQAPTHGIMAALLALAGVRVGAVVLDLTPSSSLVRAAGAAAGRTGVVVAAPPAALTEGLPAALRAATVTNAFASLPGSRVLTALRPLLRAGARVAVTAVTPEAIQEACTVAAYDLLHLEQDVDGVVVAALRARQPT